LLIIAIEAIGYPNHSNISKRKVMVIKVIVNANNYHY